VLTALVCAACAVDEPSPTASVAPTPVVRSGADPVLIGEPIDLATLTGRIVFDDFEDIYTMAADGSDLRRVTSRDGAEFDGAWSPDGSWIVYRDSRRGINEDDEIYVVAADGSGARNLTADPANDWGPDWSPDGEWIVFNSDRGAGPMSGWLVRPDRSGLRRIEVDGWVEYPSFSPDGTRIAFMGHAAGDYDIYVADIATGETTQLTDAPGSDGWPAWSPDGTLIAFKSDRDDCLYSGDAPECWRTGEAGDHHDIWIMNADGTDQRRGTPEQGQFVTWSPDGDYLLISGRTLFVVRRDGTGRVELRPPGLPYAPGGIPDWTR
jgi:TolB protein